MPIINLITVASKLTRRCDSKKWFGPSFAQLFYWTACTIWSVRSWWLTVCKGCLQFVAVQKNTFRVQICFLVKEKFTQHSSTILGLKCFCFCFRLWVSVLITVEFFRGQCFYIVLFMLRYNFIFSKILIKSVTCRQFSLV